MNRRTFAIASTIGLATIAQNAAAQRTAKTKTAVSEFTGGVVDYSNTQLELVQSHIDETDLSEHFHFQTAAGSRFDIAFWPREHGSSIELVNWYIGMIESNNLGEVQADDHFDDGGWFIMDTTHLDYFEYQIGSYPEHDLVTLTWNYEDEFEFIIEEAQKILIDGMPPMLFLDESEVMAAAKPKRTTRTASSTNATVAATSSDAVAQVRKHQRDFHESLSLGFEHLDIATDDTSSEEAKGDALLELLLITVEWQNAPVYAKEVVFADTEAELQSLYLNWADLLRELGFAVEGLLLGSGSADQMTAAQKAFTVVDEELADLLATMANFGSAEIACQEQGLTRYV